MNKLISTVQRVQHYLLLEQNIFLKYRLHFADSTWTKIRDLMGVFFHLLTPGVLIHTISLPGRFHVSSCDPWAWHLEDDLLHFFNYRIHTWKIGRILPRKYVYTVPTLSQVSLLQEIPSLLTPTAVLPPPPFPTLRMIIILFFWDSFIFFSLSSIFGVGTCHGTVELKSLEVEE